MVDVKRQDVHQFLKGPPASISVFLVCGADTGLVSERCEALVKAIVGLKPEAFQVLKFDGDTLSGDEKRLADEALSISLFGDRRLIWISAGGKNFSKGLGQVLELESIENKILIEAGALKADSALKKLCSKSSKAAVIECWPDGPREISLLLDEESERMGVVISPAARALLMNSLGGDRLLTRSEIEKLALYCRDSGKVDVADVSDIVSDAASWSFDEVIFTAFEGGRNEISEEVQKSFKHTEANVLLSLSIAHCLSLLSACLEIESGKSADQAIERFPRSFGPRRAAILNQLRKWSARGLVAQLQKLQEAVSTVRREPRLQHETVSRALLSIAYSAGRPV